MAGNVLHITSASTECQEHQISIDRNAGEHGPSVKLGKLSS
jgi:hypothetical protein